MALVKGKGKKAAGCVVAQARCSCRPDTPGRHKALVMRARAAVPEMLHEYPSLNSVARALGTSPWHLSRIFKAETGESFSQFLRKERLHVACEMLHDSHPSVKQIAHRTGFRNPDYFSSWFREHTGEPPTSYRASILSVQQGI